MLRLLWMPMPSIFLSKLKLSSKLPKKLILTPHPGEAARLLNTDVATIESDRFTAAAKIQQNLMLL